jgi:hypothetical protein
MCTEKHQENGLNPGTVLEITLVKDSYTEGLCTQLFDTENRFLFSTQSIMRSKEEILIMARFERSVG